MPLTSKLSKQEKLLLVNEAYGRAMLSAHALEFRLSSLLICKLATSKNASDSEVEVIKKLPLGLLIKKFTAEFDPSESLLEELDNMLHFRNELAHRIAIMILREALHSEWEGRLILELQQISEYFCETMEMLTPYVQEYTLKLGLTTEKILELGYEVYPGARP